MRTHDQLRQTLAAAARTIQRSARARGASRTNVAVRKNVKVVSNVGHSGGASFAAATQTAPIHQDGATPAAE